MPFFSSQLIIDRYWAMSSLYLFNNFDADRILSKIAPGLTIEANFHRPLGLKEVASNLGYSPTYLTNIVRQKTGRTVKQWIIERRMHNARQLLLHTEKEIAQIATDTGYTDTGYFIR